MHGAWERPAEDDTHIAWVRDFWSALRPFSSGGAFNFLTEDADEERRRAAPARSSMPLGRTILTTCSARTRTSAPPSAA